MSLFLDFFFRMISRIVSLMDTTIFTMYGVNVSVWSISLGGLFLALCISVFWRGAKS